MKFGHVDDDATNKVHQCIGRRCKQAFNNYVSFFRLQTSFVISLFIHLLLDCVRSFHFIFLIHHDLFSHSSKRLGNAAFAQKDYKTAITNYTKAIQTTETANRHIFFSNRSASHAGLRQWSKAIDDAKECIRLDPQFIKGYYRLATAQIEAKDLAGAESTIKQGLSLDADNTQLLKVLRSIKLHKKAADDAKKTATNGPSSLPTGQQNHLGYPSSMSSSGAGGRILDAATVSELQDLQRQYTTTVREYNLVQANYQKAVREDKMYNITLKELEDNPATASSASHSDGGGGGEYYRRVGKIFMKSTYTDVIDHLHKNIDHHRKKQQDHQGKLQYLEKKLKSQQLNMNELTGGSEGAGGSHDGDQATSPTPEEATTTADVAENNGDGVGGDTTEMDAQ